MQKEPCAICDKMLTYNTTGCFVRMDTAFNPITENADVEDIGCFPVGKGCAKHIGKGLRISKAKFKHLWE